MSGFESTHTRFLRPIDVARIRRNQNRIQVQRVLRIGRNVTFLLMAVVAGFWIYGRMQSDVRFAVKAVEVAGIVHSPRPEVERVTSRYAGTNLFQIDIAQVQRDLGAIPWIDRIDIEKKLPDTLRIRVTERTPVALTLSESGLHYVDEHGVAFAALSPEVGNPDLPLVTGAAGADLLRCVELLRDLARNDKEMHARISEVRPLAPDGFALFDRELTAFVYVTRTELARKWRTLHAVARAEGFGPGSMAYADLRFNDRIVIKPREGQALDQGVTDGTN
ncbi:MAG TPA: FtsQ-type POTRA domain-containing protein [Thermoanaerobaculia bacterium]|nr:FtsQ-type POTRA domain-containing protein [Thermoanaerobaculia bacterium]